MDFIADEKLANCSAESTGVYIRLMCIMHKMDDYGSVTLKAKEKQNPSNLANFAFKLMRQMPYTQEVIERSLAELADEGVITIEGDRLYQKRMVRDGELSRKRAEAGAKGGKGSKNQSAEYYQDKQSESKTPSKSRSKTEANTEIEIEYENESEIEGDIKDGSSKKPSLIEERFDQWWAAYPRKVGKGNAKKIFLKIAPDKTLFEKMMTTLEKAKHCEQWTKEHGQYIPHPSTWLGQGRWDDEYGAAEGAAHDDTPFDWNGDNPYEKWGT
jgi:hypothetical protein